MNGYFIGQMPGFEDYNLFSEKPIVAVLETEGATQEHLDGSATTTGGKFQIVSFDNISEAMQFSKKHENPDKAPTTVKIYAFGDGGWKQVTAVAQAN